MGKPRVTLRVLPDDRTIAVEPGETLITALASAGILLRADCGGNGRCGKCRVSIRTDQSEKTRSALACQTAVEADLRVEIPGGSRLAPEVLQKDRLTPADGVRLPLIQGPLPPDHDCGLAVDIGTTTIAVYLCDLVQGGVAASASLKNPQALFGADVMSRITALSQRPERLTQLRQMTVDAVEQVAGVLCHTAGTDPSRIRKITAVGNPTMIHLFTGRSPAPLGIYPYQPAFTAEQRITAGDLGFRYLKGSVIHTLPLVSGFVGSDAVAGALAMNLEGAKEGTLLVDVGTNGEVLLKGPEGLVATSCATGPAFEGATISHGMPAVSGSIDRVGIEGDGVRYSVIGDGSTRPVGICGSGVLSAAAALLAAGVTGPDGRFRTDPPPHPMLRREGERWVFVLAPAEAADSEGPIRFTQSDVRAVQLAKGALRTGIDILCEAGGIDGPGRLLLAGAFGAYLDKHDALGIGMFPPIPPERIAVAGNAAGIGAVMALLDDGVRKAAAAMASTIRVVDLAAHPEFQDRFIAALAFPEERTPTP